MNPTTQIVTQIHVQIPTGPHISGHATDMQIIMTTTTVAAHMRTNG
ncbi:MAG TPA: hypothetical protein VGZ73_01685 [Bryobacteraceae bacterium]|nr:hypothetical protein [Bryobacteraceae bacterium]